MVVQPGRHRGVWHGPVGELISQKMGHLKRLLIKPLDLFREVIEDFRFKLLNETFSDPKDLETIMSDLDAWVSRHGKDGYVAEDFIPEENHGLDHGIQQVRSEIREFVRVLLSKGLHGSILEIGLGDHGGTHILWRSIFDRVVTIEKSDDLIKRFKHSESLDSRSLIIMGASQDPRTLKRIKRVLNSIDVLFIDGDHEYEAVYRDWVMYHGLVRPGGSIAFHDSICKQPHVGVAAFLEKLSNGEVDGKRHRLRHIVYSCEVGISYEEC